MGDTGDWAEALWDAYPDVCTKVLAGAGTARGLEAYIKATLQADDAAAKVLTKATSGPVWAEIGTFRAALNGIRSHAEVLCQGATTFKQTVMDDTITPLAEKRAHLERDTGKLVKDGQRLLKEADAMKARVGSAQTKYNNKCIETEQAQETARALGRDSTVTPKQLTQTAKKTQKLMQERNKLDVDYEDSVKRANEHQATVDGRINIMLSELQQAEVERMVATRTHLKAFVSARLEYLKEQQEHLEQLNALLDDIDPENDNMLFASEKRTGEDKPLPLEFEPYAMSEDMIRVTEAAGQLDMRRASVVSRSSTVDAASAPRPPVSAAEPASPGGDEDS